MAAREEGHDAESHLLAGRIFAATIASDEHRPWTRLAHAAFWIHQRQEVLHSITRQNMTRTSISISRSIFHEGADSADLYTWAKRAQALAGEVTDFCFDQDAQPRVQLFEQLQQRLQQWLEVTSPTFRPLLFFERDPAAGRILPEIRFSLKACCT